MPAHPSETPAKKQSKWSADEDALIIDLRGSGMKWEDISKRLPGRSSISCRLHYQNYLERRSEWDEERKNKLARLYERFKPEMWSKVAEEMAVPWRAAEAMHWQMGEAEMARRAGVVPFSLTTVNVDAPAAQRAPNPRQTPMQRPSHSHSHSSSGIPASSYSSSGHGARFQRSNQQNSPNSSRSLAARRESTPRSVPPHSPSEGYIIAGVGNPITMGRAITSPGPPILPSVAEMTTGVSPYSTPAYSVSPSMAGLYSGPGPLLPSINSAYGIRPGVMIQDGKRRGSPDIGPRETSRRRQER